MSNAITIKLNVDLDYRFNYVDYEDLGSDLIFEKSKSNSNLHTINYKNRLLTAPLRIPFDSVDEQLINDGGRVKFEVIGYEESDSNESVELILKVSVDASNTEKAKKAKKILEEFKKTVDSKVGIYRIKVNGSTYVGQSTDLKRRLTKHVEQLTLGIHVNRGLQNLWEEKSLEIKFEILEYEKRNKEGIKLQDWLASREKLYIELDRKSGKNLNILDGEVIVTKNSLNEYKKIRSDAIAYVKDVRKQNKEKNKIQIEEAMIERDSLRESIRTIDEKLDIIKKSKSTVGRMFSTIGFVKPEGEEGELLQKRKEIQSKYETHMAYFSKLRETERLLRKRKLSDDEMKTMKSLGYEYRSEYHERL
jgi:predicted GIY-YIG superfamily endonuclease